MTEYYVSQEIDNRIFSKEINEQIWNILSRQNYYSIKNKIEMFMSRSCYDKKWIKEYRTIINQLANINKQLKKMKHPRYYTLIEDNLNSYWMRKYYDNPFFSLESILKIRGYDLNKYLMVNSDEMHKRYSDLTTFMIGNR
jgi:hypothetical protein